MAKIVIYASFTESDYVCNMSTISFCGAIHIETLKKTLKSKSSDQRHLLQKKSRRCHSQTLSISYRLMGS